MRRLGVSVDWETELATSDPEYYRWTQWIFLRLLERGLAERREAAVNWCPVDQTVLANEQVIDGRCERCGAEVELRQLTQWFFRITEYAQRLLDDMDELIDWPERVLTQQRNWIGRSEGARVVFRTGDGAEEIPVFTTRPDTLFGDLLRARPRAPGRGAPGGGAARGGGRARVLGRRGARDRRRARRRRLGQDGRLHGRHVVNPVNGEALPCGWPTTS